MAVAGVEIRGAMLPGFDTILTDAALIFVANLHRQYDPTRLALLNAREARQRWWDAGNAIDFAPETASVRAGTWTVAGSPPDLQDRRVEITGPVDRKMVINALNSGARCFMADFEDASSPVWTTMIEGQANLRDAVAGT
ncbi:MAG: malate synthase A, partial [Sphingomonadaceae bacterium]|nr:malate synthase A [Sphingomonadaceae bacterium]